MSELLFTPAAVLDLLIHIDELLENRSSNLGEKIKDLKGGKINGKLASELQL